MEFKPLQLKTDPFIGGAGVLLSRPTTSSTTLYKHTFYKIGNLGTPQNDSASKKSSINTSDHTLVRKLNSTDLIPVRDFIKLSNKSSNILPLEKLNTLK